MAAQMGSRIFPTAQMQTNLESYLTEIEGSGLDEDGKMDLYVILNEIVEKQKEDELWIEIDECATQHAEEYLKQFAQEEYETFPEDDHEDEEEDKAKECLVVERYFEDEKEYLDTIIELFGIMHLKRKDGGQDEKKIKRRK